MTTGLLGPLDRLRGALVVLAATPRMLQLIWRAHPRYATAALTLNVVRGLNPLVHAWLIKLTMDAIVAAVTGRGDPMAAAGPVITLALLRCGYQAIDTAIWPVTSFAWQQLSDHLTRALHGLIMSKANSLRGIAFFESPRFFDLLQRASNQANFRPINIVSGLSSIVRDSLTLISMVAVLVVFSAPLAAFVVIACVPSLVLQFMNRRESFSMSNWTVPEVRKMGYLTGIMTNQNEAKEVRLFGLGGHFLSEYERTFDQFRQQHASVRRRTWQRN